MDLSQLNHSLYPRAVTASVEGHLRQERTQQGSAATTARKHPTATSHEQDQTLQSKTAVRRYQVEQGAQWPNAGSAQQMPGYADLPGMGEQLAVASRQARQSHARRGHGLPAMVSARGREANRRYLEITLSNQSRFIDEVV